MERRTKVLTLLLGTLLYLPINLAIAQENRPPDAIVYLKKDPLPQEINHIVAETLYITIDGQPEPNREMGLYLRGVGGENVIEYGVGGGGRRLLVTGAPWEDVNIRTGPGVQYDIVTIVSNGDELEILGKDRWWNVRLPDGTEGWITYRFTKETEGGVGTGNIFFRPYRFDTTLPVQYWRLTIKNEAGDLIGEMTSTPESPGLPTVIAWTGTDQYGRPVQVGDRLKAQIEVHYPNNERSLSNILDIRVVPAGHIRTTLKVASIDDPGYLSDPNLNNQLQQLAGQIKQYEDENVVIEYFHSTNNEMEARQRGDMLLQRIMAHPTIQQQIPYKRIFIRSYIPLDPASPLFYQQWEDKGVRFDQGDLLISSVKAKELLFDPNRAKRYMIRVDRTETVITAATGIWYNLNYADRDPSVIAFWGVPMFPTEGPPSYVEEEGRWLRRGSIDIGLATTYGHTDTHVSGNVANSNTTGIDKAYAEIDLTWWGFPFFGEVFGTDLGAMVAYRNNVYDHNTDVKGNLAPTNLIRPNISWLWTNLMYRFAWGPYYDSPQAWAKVGYVFYDFDVATSPLVVVDKTFNGAYVGGRFLFPLNGLLNNLNMYVDAGAAMGDYKERGRSSVSPVTPKKYATLFRGETALSYYWTEWFSTDAQFWVDSLFMNFNPSGDVIETYWGFAGLRLQFRI